MTSRMNCLFLLIFGMHTNCLAQSTSAMVTSVDTSGSFYGPEFHQATFCGGNDSLRSYISYYTRFPESARADGIQGRSEIQFLVDETGKISHLEIFRPLGAPFDSEMKRVVQEMPLWEPATFRNFAVPSVQVLRFSFKLE